MMPFYVISNVNTCNSVKFYILVEIFIFYFFNAVLFIVKNVIITPTNDYQLFFDDYSCDLLPKHFLQ